MVAVSLEQRVRRLETLFSTLIDELYGTTALLKNELDFNGKVL